VSLDTEALIREARRLRRRRWAVRVSLVVAVAVAGISYGIVSGSGRAALPSHQLKASHGKQAPAATLPAGPKVTLDVAGSLAVGPSGALYVAEPNEHRILVRLGTGAFRVVAGTGIAGYSGNGDKAVDAKLFNPTNLTFDERGDLFFVDGGRVREIRADGVIVTVAGDGSTTSPALSPPVATVANNTPALAASFHSVPSIALGPSGTLYIVTNTQLLRMTKSDRLDTIRTHRDSFGHVPRMPTSLNEGLTTLAVANNGGIYVSGFNGWAIWYVAPNGRATYVGYDRGSGGTFPDLTRGPSGVVYADNGGGIVRLDPKGLIPVDPMVKVDGQYFSGTYFAFGPRGALYADETPGNIGFERRQELVSVRNGHTKILWTESESVAKRHTQL
jgi:hypothetical protein